MSTGDQENCALAFGMRREEIHDVIVVKRKSGGAQFLRVGGEVQFPAENSRLELGRAVTAISESGNNLRQIGKKEKIDARIRGKFLLQT